MKNTRDWSNGPLYAFLMNTFPEHRTAYTVFDVGRLSDEIGMSRERIYQWFRRGKMSPDNARTLVTLAAAEPNATALTAAGRTPPVLQDFLPFF